MEANSISYLPSDLPAFLPLRLELYIDMVDDWIKRSSLSCVSASFKELPTGYVGVGLSLYSTCEVSSKSPCKLAPRPPRWRLTLQIHECDYR